MTSCLGLGDISPARARGSKAGYPPAEPEGSGCVPGRAPAGVVLSRIGQSRAVVGRQARKPPVCPRVSGYNRPTDQFAMRVPVLAQRVGVAITEAEARSIYNDRSGFVHGRLPNYTDLSEDIMERYRRFETAIRLSLLKASSKSEFADLFATDGEIESTFGSIPKQPRKDKCAGTASDLHDVG
jgi:hypothetical protein